MTTLLSCLGNPGEKYTLTRHNIGFLIADALIDELSLPKANKKCKSLLYNGSLEEESLLIQKPQTFMNLSGEAVQHVLYFYKIPTSQCIVIYDDIDLPFGHLRFRKSGGAGTHNGMRSIISHIKTTDFPRLRVGVGPVPPRWNVADYVLSNFLDSELDHLPVLFKRCHSFFSQYLSGNENEALKSLHTNNPKPKVEENHV